MGGGVSRRRGTRVTPAPISSNKSSRNSAVQQVNYDKSVQTSTLNLHTERPVVSISIMQDAAVQANIQNFPITTSMTNGTVIKLLPEIKLSTDRTRTISEIHYKNPRNDLITSKKHRQYISDNCNNVKSIAELVQKIENYSNSDLDHAWLLFHWITKHITYVSSHTGNTVDAVFRTRTGASRGFTHLFTECCRLLKIECVDVLGHVKENSFQIGDSLQNATHIWNAVKLSGRWYLLDTTWGAGHGKEKQTEDSYFLTSPDQMIYTHLPTEDTWQLLSPPITKQEFLDLPIVKSAYYRLNLKLISPTQCVVETNQPLFEVVIKTPPDVTLTTAMKAGDINCPDFHQLSQYDYMDGMTRCYFSPANDGTYDLTIYGKTNKETKYMDAIYMRLKVVGLFDAPAFPVLYRPFTERRCTLIEPFRRILYAGEYVTIQMRIPNATKVRVHNGDEVMSSYGYEDEILTKEIMVQGDVIVYGIFDPSDQLQPICKFSMA